MTTPTDPQGDEARAAYQRYLACRAEIEAGKRPWSALSEFFTDDAVFIDPAWGRIEGRDEILRFMDHSMQGLDDWSFPEAFTMVDGHRVVSFWWNTLPGARADGSSYQAPAVSILHYAGDGRFSYELDILNMAEVSELIAESGWRPPPEMNLPPAHPTRTSTPRAQASP
jgi:ketosteroid isomerase-like protein